VNRWSLRGKGVSIKQEVIDTFPLSRIKEMNKNSQWVKGVYMTKKIMTVDDSASIRQMVRFALETGGYEVCEAKNGKDALTRLNGTESVDMLVTDLSMPEMDGIELTKQIRATPQLRYLPVVVLTTESHADRKSEGKRAGVTGWIVKPFKPEQLVGVVKKVLR
jgi:two-component system chemotaxis response regulator CheY